MKINHLLGENWPFSGWKLTVFPEGGCLDQLRGRWLGKIGLWERWLDQIGLWGRWLEKIRRRWLDKIQFQWPRPENIRGRWFDNIVLCRWAGRAMHIMHADVNADIPHAHTCTRAEEPARYVHTYLYMPAGVHLWWLLPGPQTNHFFVNSPSKGGPDCPREIKIKWYKNRHPKCKFRHPKYKFRHPEYSDIRSDTQGISSDTQSISSDTQTTAV